MSQGKQQLEAWNIIFTIIAAVSVVNYAFQTHPSFRIDTSNRNLTIRYSEIFHTNLTNPKKEMFLTSTMHPVIFWLDVTCNTIFSVDLVLRLIFCPCRKRLSESLVTTIETLSVISVWIYLFIEENPSILVNYLSFTVLEIVLPMCVLRIARFFRILEHNTGMKILFLAVKASTKLLILLAISILVGVIIFASLVYVSEFETNSTFPDFFISMWWAIITMTTVGYGDHYPISIAGHVVGAICAIFGVLLLALPIAIISTNFNNYYAMSKDMERHELMCTTGHRLRKVEHSETSLSAETFM